VPARRGEVLQHRTPRRTVTIPRELGPLEQFTLVDEPIELGVIGEKVMHAVDFTGTGRTGGHRDRQPHLGVGASDLGDNRALADAGRPGKDRQAPGRDGAARH
jgi:hypothetical protein